MRHCGVSSLLSTPAVCRGLPTAPVDGGYWPESCRNTLVGDFCVSVVSPREALQLVQTVQPLDGLHGAETSCLQT